MLCRFQIWAHLMKWCIMFVLDTRIQSPAHAVQRCKHFWISILLFEFSFSYHIALTICNHNTHIVLNVMLCVFNHYIHIYYPLSICFKMKRSDYARLLVRPVHIQTLIYRHYQDLGEHCGKWRGEISPALIHHEVFIPLLYR